MVVCPYMYQIATQVARQMEVTEVKNPINVKITDGQTTKVVHVNRLQHRKQPQHDTVPPSDTYTNWVPAQIDHHVFPVFPPSDVIRNVPDDHRIGFACKAWGQALKRRGHM